jgi:hypothetical protein
VNEHALEPPSPATCRAQPPRRRLRAAPPPYCARSDWRGAERAPLAKPGTLPAMEARRVEHHSRELCVVAARPATASSIPRAGRRPSTEYGGGRKRAARRASTGRWGQPHRGFESLSLRRCPLAVRRFDEARRRHPSVLAALRASAGRRGRKRAAAPSLTDPARRWRPSLWRAKSSSRAADSESRGERTRI